MSVKATGAPVNFGALLDQIVFEYECDGEGLVHGIQKDAIQNGWGARLPKKKWSFAFQLIKSSGNTYLTMTDAGTTGLSGKVYAREDLPDTIPPSERLARFEALFDSGGNIGAGLFGRGKLIFSGASKDRLIYYDSITEDGVYRFGRRHFVGRNIEQTTPVLEGESARKELKKLTLGALAPLSESGTRITVVNPRAEVISAVRTGKLARYIEETWWEIIKKHSAEIVVIQENGQQMRAQVPVEFGGLPEKDGNKWKVHKKDLVNISIQGDRYRIKTIHLLLSPEGKEMSKELRRVHVHRRGMKVGPVNVGTVPDVIEDRFFGYVLLEPSLEARFAEIENTTHYGFSRRTATFQAVKRAVMDEVDEFMQRLGYGSGGGDANEKTKRSMEDARAELNMILSGLGVPGFGTGVEPPPGIRVSIEGLEFPNDTNYLSTGDTVIGFWFTLSNGSDQEVRGALKIYTHDRSGKTIEALASRNDLSIDAGNSFETDVLTIAIKKGKYPQYEKFGCTAKLSGDKGQVLAKKTFYFFVDLKEPPPEEQFAAVKLKPVGWPREGSRRVDYGDSIKNVCHTVESLTPQKMHLKMKVRTLWASERNEPIDLIKEEDFALGAFQEKDVQVEETKITEDVYGEVERGKINLRCHAVATKKTKSWDKGEKMAEHTVAFYLNMDPDYGFFEDHDYWGGGADGPRSEAAPIEGGKAWCLRINIDHPAYIAAAEDKGTRQMDYFVEESTRQVIYVLLRKNEFDSLKKLAGLDLSKELMEMDHEDMLRHVAYNATDRIMAEYYKE